MLIEGVSIEQELSTKSFGSWRMTCSRFSQNVSCFSIDNFLTPRELSQCFMIVFRVKVWTIDVWFLFLRHTSCVKERKQVVKVDTRCVTLNPSSCTKREDTRDCFVKRKAKVEEAGNSLSGKMSFEKVVSSKILSFAFFPSILVLEPK